MADKVKPLKMETSIDGTQNDMFPTEANPSQDYLSAKGVAFENSDTRLIDLDGSGNIQILDATETTAIQLHKFRDAAFNTFDNTGTTLVATNVQAAIEELDSTVEIGPAGESVAANTTQVTSSNTYIVINSMSIVAPLAGNWTVQFNAQFEASSNNAEYQIAIFVDAVEQPDSIRVVSGSNKPSNATTFQKVTVTLGQTITAQVKMNGGGNVQIDGRTLSILKVT